MIKYETTGEAAGGKGIKLFCQLGMVRLLAGWGCWLYSRKRCRNNWTWKRAGFR